MNTIKHYLFFAALSAVAGGAMAQDSYDAQTLSHSDLNGTARFVAMGGALGALGGDISVMGTNPAGTAMYRKGDAAITLGGLFTGQGARNHDGTRMSLDQGGMVVAFDMDNPTSKGLQFINFGINYQKNRNFLFNQHTNVGNLNGEFSQTWQIADLCLDSYANDYWGTLSDMSAVKYKDNDPLNEAASNIEHEGILQETYNFTTDAATGKKTLTDIDYRGLGAKSAYYERATFGGISQCDFNLSFNISDRFFLGASMGAYNIDYTRESFYQEVGVDGNFYDFSNWYKTKGDGFDIKLGFICRPFEDSPFRFGLAAHTPIWYRMTDANGSTLYYNDSRVTSASNAEYDYRFRTSWKLNASMGFTIDKFIAFGAEYEYEDLGTLHYNDFNYDDVIYFANMNKIIAETFKEQHTLKLGLEVKPVDEFAMRVGYNLVSSPFRSDAFRTIGYDGIYTETDYVNWGPINRFTFGLGYRYNGGYFDVTYQNQSQEGDFYAFDDVDLKPTKINANRSQIMCTLGFRF